MTSFEALLLTLVILVLALVIGLIVCIQKNKKSNQGIFAGFFTQNKVFPENIKHLNEKIDTKPDNLEQVIANSFTEKNQYLVEQKEKKELTEAKVKTLKTQLTEAKKVDKKQKGLVECAEKQLQEFTDKYGDGSSEQCCTE